MNESLLSIEDPVNYFLGVGENKLPTPTNILMFVRRSKQMLQQEALQNRSHHRHVLILNLETSGHVHVDNLDLPLRAGQALLILPYQFHHFSMLASNSIRWLFCTFELEPCTFLEPLRNQVMNIDDASLQACETLLRQWHQLEAELQTAKVQTSLLFLLILLKQARYIFYDDLPGEASDSLVRTVNRLMTESRGHKLVVGDLADAIGYSESRLRVLFKDASGIPLGSYIQNYRIHRAMALLRTTTLSIADVAEEAGFGSPQAFSRIFKKEIGQTPRDYRDK